MWQQRLSQRFTSPVRPHTLSSYTMTVVCVCASALVLLLAQPAVGLEFYSYGPAYDSQLARQNDVSSQEIPLAVPITFFGETYDSIFVSRLIN